MQFFSWFKTCSFWKIHCFTFFPYKSIRDQIWPCRKICLGQPRIISWINLVVFKLPMLHTKFQGHQPFGSGEEDFLKFLPYMGMAAILVMRPGPFEQTFVPPSHGDTIWNLASISPLVSEENMFQEYEQQMNGRTGRRWPTEAYLCYKLTNEPSAQVS